MHGKHQRADDETRDRRKVRYGIVSHAFVDMRIQGKRTLMHDDERIAILGTLCSQLRADVAACSTAVVDHDRLAERGVQSFRYPARADIGNAARRPRDEPDRTVGVVLRKRLTRGERSQRKQHHEATRGSSKTDRHISTPLLNLDMRRPSCCTTWSVAWIAYAQGVRACDLGGRFQ